MACTCVINSVAVYLVFYDDLKTLTGSSGSGWAASCWTPVNLAYDEVNNAVWLAEMESIHQLTSDLQWNRYGYAQLAPCRTSAVSVWPTEVWVGSDKAGMSRLWSDTAPAAHSPRAGRWRYSQCGTGERKRGTFRDPKGDPWTWLYYYGQRYLPSSVVIDIVSANEPGGEDASVFVVTTAGLALLHVEPWTLLWRRHRRGRNSSYRSMTDMESLLPVGLHLGIAPSIPRSAGLGWIMDKHACNGPSLSLHSHRRGRCQGTRLARL